ncbi:unnamed protein product [Arabis nemorensis]|uniref:Uncharacterized protein n=1 Tax=Arabis nemorensis TaxID=586526 RepID=A0A565AYG8_9BRAS|nr:unnamed protein product [Arabis nemorensis]
MRELKSFKTTLNQNQQWPPVGSPTNLRRDEPRRSQFEDSVNAVSFGFVATAILISMFLVMAIFERLIRTTTSTNSDSSPGLDSRVGSNSPASTKLGHQSPKIGVYSKGVSVLMPGDNIPTFIAHPKKKYLIHSPDEPEPWFKPKYLTRTEKDVPLRTTEQEIALMNGQILATEGFDIDYTQFRCLFNYHSVDFNAKEFVEEPETNLDLLNRLCHESLDDYNQENYSFFYESNFVFCRPKSPVQQVSTDEDSVGDAEKDPKKPRLE